MMMTVQTDRRLASAARRSTRYGLASVMAPRVERAVTRPAVNVSFVLDRSGSMGGQKFVLARTAVDHALQLLRDDDRFSVVVYDDQIDVVAESAQATPSACRHARQRLESIQPRASTDLCGGWLAGCEEVAKYLDEGSMGRCLLLTDHEAIVSHVRELRRRGVVTSTFGVGADFDERLLQQMADAGGGHFYFIEKPVQISDFLTSELGETLEIVASGVKLTIETAAGQHATLLSQFPSLQSAQGLSIELGDLVSGQQTAVVTQFEFAPDAEGAITHATFTLSSSDGRVSQGPVEQTWTFATESACEIQARNQLVDEAVGAVYAARARAEAVELNRRGDFASAERILKEVALRIGQYAGSSPALARAIAELEGEAGQVATGMSALALKRLYYRSSSALRSRSPEGKANRRSE
jgi:Ca-activated chloride channel family protein